MIESISNWSILIFQGLYNYNISKHTQSEVVEFLASMLMCVPEKQRDDVAWNISYLMVKYKVDPIPDGTFDYILTENELKSKQVDSYLDKFVVVPNTQYITYKVIDIFLDETPEEIPSRQDIICHYENISVKENWSIEIAILILFAVFVFYIM